MSLFDFFKKKQSEPPKPASEGAKLTPAAGEGRARRGDSAGPPDLPGSESTALAFNLGMIGIVDYANGNLDEASSFDEICFVDNALARLLFTDRGDRVELRKPPRGAALLRLPERAHRLFRPDPAHRSVPGKPPSESESACSEA